MMGGEMTGDEMTGGEVTGPGPDRRPHRGRGRRRAAILTAAFLVAPRLIGALTATAPTAAGGHAGPPEAHGWAISTMARVVGAWPASARAAEPAGAGTEAPAEGAGAEEHAPTFELGRFGLQLLNFAILLVVLVKFGGGAINKMLAARHLQLKSDLAAASDLRAAAEAKLASQEQRLGRLESEIEELRQSIRQEAESEKHRLMAAADERARRIQSETAFLVEQQVREAEVKLRRESVEVALGMAEDILRRAVGPADQQRFLDRFVADAAEIGPPGRGTATDGSAPTTAGSSVAAAAAVSPTALTGSAI
jgi:F-type H+-transporting ATPase subunit b